MAVSETFKREAYLTGLNQVLANLNKEIRGIEGRTAKGLREAARLVRRDAQKRVPVDTGKLKASAYTRMIKGSSGPGTEIGFTAAYAIFVHERMDLRHAVGTAKFLQYALSNNTKEIVDIIARNAAGKSSGPGADV